MSFASTPEICKTFWYWETTRSIKISNDMNWSYSQRRNLCIVKWLWHFMTTWYSTVFIFMTIFHAIWNFCNSAPQLIFIFYLYIVFNSLYVNIVFYIILLIIFCRWFQQEFRNSCICDQIYINIFLQSIEIKYFDKTCPSHILCLISLKFKLQKIFL